MIRVLLMIAAAGFVLSLATLSAAVAIGGPEAITRGGWHMAGRDWAWDWDHDDDEIGRGGPHALGPQTTRVLAWSGADRLELELPADVRYIQSNGPSSVAVAGPERAVDRVVIRGDSIRYSSRRHSARLSIVLTAPRITSFDISGRNTLAIEGYRQPQMNLDVSGAAEVSAKGEVEELNVDVSGDGDLDLGALTARRANVEVSGAADAILAPTEEARIDISGLGDVRLLTNPARLQTDVSGSGKLRREAPAEKPPSSPSPLPKP